MSSQPSYKYYANPGRMSRIRAIAESAFNIKNNGFYPHLVTPAEAYEIAVQQPWITVTDLLVDPELAKGLGLDSQTRVILDNHGSTVGRSAQARVFYNQLDQAKKEVVEGILREAVYNLQCEHDLIVGEAVIGLDPALMFKARLLTAKEDAPNLFFWFANFTPLSAVPSYTDSIEHPIQDILFISYPNWKPPTSSPFGRAMVVVDEQHNTIFNLGLRYFGERKKGTLTLAWTGAQRLGHVSAHGGIKEVDLTNCPKFAHRGRQVIAFYGLSGSGKSSHTNSLDNAGTLPKGFTRTIAHDDAFQIDLKNKLCYVWEPTLFDKTDSREINHPDWKHCLAVMNNLGMEIDGKILPIGLDTRNNNGRAIFARKLLGSTCDRIGFPNYIGWLMKDNTLPPIVKITDRNLAVALGATLMTKRTAAENISPEDMKKLIFEPFANPFRVYPLYEDCLGYEKVFESGCECYVWSGGGGGWWDGDDQKSKPVTLKSSLTLQTAILTGILDWEPWDLLDGAWLPTQETVDSIIPNYYDTYNPVTIPNQAKYLIVLKDRFNQRVAFLNSSDIKEKPKLLSRLVASLKIKS